MPWGVMLPVVVLLLLLQGCFDASFRALNDQAMAFNEFPTTGLYMYIGFWPIPGFCIFLL